MTVAINYPMLSIVGDIGEDYPVTEFIGSSSILKLMDGSRTTVDIGDNKVMETFKVFADATPVVIQANVRVVERHLAKAGQVERLQSPMERIRLFERLTDEARGRLSTILSGSITPIDEGVVSRTQYFSSAVYVVNITRRRLWEMTVAYDKFDALVHGGQFTLPEKMTVGTNSGRISLFAISGVDETVINEFWVGIKSAPSNYELNDFSPEIQVVHNIGRVNDNFSGWSTGSDYIGGWAVQVGYGTGTDWARAYDTHLPDFNSVTAAGNSNAIYHGKYHLLIRYKTSFDYGERYGLRVKFGWKTDISAATLEPVYLDPSPDAFRYVDLGVISIGGETFSYDTVGNTNLNTFGISIQSAVFDPYTVVGETKSILYFDSMSLVPAENYVYAKLSSPIGGETGAEIYARDDGSSYGLVVERIPGGRTIDSLVNQSVLGPRNVIELIPIVDSADWNMPTDNSKIILVAGNDTGNKTTAQAKIDLGVISRTVGL